MAQYIPTTAAPAGAPQIDVANLLPASTAIGPVRALYDRLTGTYSAMDKEVIRSAYNILARAGTLPILDVVGFKMGNEHDSLLNWKGGASAINTGGTFGAKGFALDGVDDLIDPKFVWTGAGNYKQDLATFGAYVSDSTHFGDVTPSYLIGRNGGTNGAAHSFISPRSNATQSAMRLNNATSTNVTYDGPLYGLWAAYRFRSSDEYLFRDGDSVINGAAVVSTGLPTDDVPAVIGKNASTYYRMSVCGWFSGGAMSSARRNAVRMAFELMRRHFVGDVS